MKSKIAWLIYAAFIIFAIAIGDWAFAIGATAGMIAGYILNYIDRRE
jgi:hypothetical protein